MARTAPRRLRLVRQRDEWDCGVAALAMALGVSYPAVRRAIAGDVDARRDGLYPADLVAIAAALGVSLRAVRARAGHVAVDANAVAILGVLINGDLARAHWTVLHRHRIYCPTGVIAPVATYLARGEPFALLVAA